MAAATIVIDGRELSSQQARVLHMAVRAFALNLEVGDAGGRAGYLDIQRHIADLMQLLEPDPRPN